MDTLNAVEGAGLNVRPTNEQLQLDSKQTKSIWRIIIQMLFIMDFSLLTTSGVSQKRNEAVGNTKPPAMRVEDKLLYKKITFPL